ncbi:hypothetical protein [Amycolatopsis sp. WGS_07]|uniref:hypothetical protein n=1 Tax=Amycolatopsis sp. WGS_07 TaxID=3076764 RepID=UPI003873AA8E
MLAETHFEPVRIRRREFFAKAARLLERIKGGRKADGMQRHLDLIAFVAVLATGVLLTALGVTPESIALIAIALTGLYVAWRTGRPGQNPPGQGE